MSNEDAADASSVTEKCSPECVVGQEERDRDKYSQRANFELQQNTHRVIIRQRFKEEIKLKNQLQTISKSCLNRADGGLFFV